MRAFLYTLLLLSCALGAPLAAQTPAPASGDEPEAQAVEIETSMLRLRNGSIHFGQLEEHSPDGIVFRRLDTGGRVRLAWSFLDPALERELRVRFGYVDLSSDEITISADKLVLVDGSEVVGKIVGRTDTEILLKVRGGALPVPKDRVRSASSGVLVPALEIYTKDELYTQELVKLDPVDPASHHALGVFCERILDFRKALVHYTSASELDPEFNKLEMKNLLERTQTKADAQEQVDFLADIDHLKRRKKYQEALSGCELFDQSYPNSPLRTERLALEKRILKALDRDLRRVVEKSWFRRMERLASAAARQNGYEGSISYAGDQMSEDLLQAVTQDARKTWAEVTEDQLLQMWVERKRSRWRPASYGHGTWLLGEDAALAGLPQQEAEAAPAGGKSQERAAIEDKIKRYLKNQEMQRRAQRNPEDEGDIEDFWKGLSLSARTNWIVAYYVENSGQFDLKAKPELRNCTECGGTGAREIIYTGSAKTGGGKSGTRLITCPTCHGIGRTRRIRYR